MPWGKQPQRASARTRAQGRSSFPPVHTRHSMEQPYTIRHTLEDSCSRTFLPATAHSDHRKPPAHRTSTPRSHGGWTSEVFATDSAWCSSLDSSNWQGSGSAATREGSSGKGSRLAISKSYARAGQDFFYPRHYPALPGTGNYPAQPGTSPRCRDRAAPMTRHHCPQCHRESGLVQNVRRFPRPRGAIVTRYMRCPLCHQRWVTRQWVGHESTRLVLYPPYRGPQAP